MTFKGSLAVIWMDAKRDGAAVDGPEVSCLVLNSADFLFRSQLFLSKHFSLNTATRYKEFYITT